MKKIAIVVAGAMIPMGLSACAAPAHALACTAVATAAPTQGGTEVVAIRSVGDAGVLARATYRHEAPGALTSTNAVGLAHVAFPVPDAGYSVKVTVLTVHGHQVGSCAAYFIPVQRKVSIPAPVKKPTPTPAPPSGPAVVTCNDVNFPALFPPFTIAHHSYDITARATDCLTARTLATDAQGYHGSPAPLEDVVGYTCVNSYPDNGFIDSATYSCTSSGTSTAKVTFDYSGFPTADCTSPNPSVADLLEANSDCSFATAVAQAGWPNAPGSTYGETYSADGFSCSIFTGLDPSTAQVLPYVCFTPDKLSTIQFNSLASAS